MYQPSRFCITCLTTSLVHAHVIRMRALEEVCCDQDLLAALRKDDECAFERFVVTVYDDLVRYALRISSSADYAEEVVQDVLVGIWFRRGDLRVTTSLRVYLRSAIRYAAARRGRAERRRREIPLLAMLEYEFDEEDGESDRTTLLLRVQRAVAQLPDQTRLIFSLQREHGMRAKEIAVLLGISVHTAEKMSAQALLIIRRSLGVGP